MSLPSAPTATVTAATLEEEEEEEETYNSSSDEDFDLENNAVGHEPVTESSDDENPTTAEGANGGRKGRTVKKRKAGGDGDGEDLGGRGETGLELDSGDEATIRRGRKKRRRGKGDGSGGAGLEVAEEEEEEGGEGGLVKTRAQRAREEKERRPLATADTATVDVDALWRGMNSAAKKDEMRTEMKATRTVPVSDTNVSKTAAQDNKANGSVLGNGTPQEGIHSTPAQIPNAPGTSTEDMITIKRTYVFAGETITEEKLVPKSSAEARLYLQSQPVHEPGSNGSSAPVTKPPLRRPKKRTSMFEPNPDGVVKGLVAPVGGANKGPKLNTIEKSKLDWAGFVDKEGIAEELDDASKAKEGYLGRMDFLGRVEAKRDEGMKGGRKK